MVRNVSDRGGPTATDIPSTAAAKGSDHLRVRTKATGPRSRAALDDSPREVPTHESTDGAPAGPRGKARGKKAQARQTSELRQQQGKNDSAEIYREAPVGGQARRYLWPTAGLPRPDPHAGVRAAGERPKASSPGAPKAEGLRGLSDQAFEGLDVAPPTPRTPRPTSPQVQAGGPQSPRRQAGDPATRAPADSNHDYHPSLDGLVAEAHVGRGEVAADHPSQLSAGALKGQSDEAFAALDFSRETPRAPSTPRGGNAPSGTPKSSKAAPSSPVAKAAVTQEGYHPSLDGLIPEAQVRPRTPEK